jgi:hypothetical protein
MGKHALKSWKEAGHPTPPPHVVKQQIVAAYAAVFRITTLVETGTYQGDMVYAMRERFQKIVSIELAALYYERARRRFRSYPQVEIRYGDSGEELASVLKEISHPCLFWLDGHYSGGLTAKGDADTPVTKEVRAILGHKIKEHVVLVDDARCFDGTRDYPEIKEFREITRQISDEHNFTVKHDVIRIYPKQNPSGRTVDV